MSAPDLHRLIRSCADPDRAGPRVLALHAQDETLWSRLRRDQRALLADLLASSTLLAELVLRHPDWIPALVDRDALARPPRRFDRQKREADAVLQPMLDRGDETAALDHLHEARLRELLRIAARDLGRFGTLEERLLELSNAADLFLAGLLELVWRRQVLRFGTPWHRDSGTAWRRTAFSVLGLGKLGGQELNYSSDVDLLFLYEEEGVVFREAPKPRSKPSRGALTAHAFFTKLCESLIREATVRGPEGGALRIDMRLRPEGDAGPIVRSLAGYENFYSEWGQTWERMMLLKARGVAGSVSLAGEFLEVIQPFRYPRSLGDGLLQEIAGIKERIEREVVRAGELDRNVKLGRGGIREIEFIAQSLQVLNAGRHPFLQTPHTLTALSQLGTYGLLQPAEVRILAEAYEFLRDVEHRLQMEHHRQTHTLPDSPSDLARLARLTGFRSPRTFDARLKRHTSRVRALYERIFKGAAPDPAPAIPPGLGDQDDSWRRLLADRGFRSPDHSLRLARGLVEGPGFGHISVRTAELGRRLLARVLELGPDLHRMGTYEPGDFRLSDPDRVLARLDSYIAAYGARASLYELWTARPNVFEHILRLFDRSEFLAELAIREPDLVDELEAGAHLGRRKDADQTLADLRHGFADTDQHAWLRRYFQTEFMRLGLRDILGYVDAEEANRELTALAEACVRYALEVVGRRHALRAHPFAVIALGKFGGSELVYGSDLDVLFVAPDRARDLPKLQKVAIEVMDLLGVRTPQGTVFAVDPRLRPDGAKGLLVQVISTVSQYYRQRAMLWEIQSLTRARFVAGDPEVGEAVVAMARDLTDFSRASGRVAAQTPDWRQSIARMRTRIERERTPPGKDALAFKTGTGGLMDIEFVAQTLAMATGCFEPNTALALAAAGRAGALAAGEEASLLENLRRLRRMESILRRWSFEGEAVLPDDPAALLRVAIRCGYRDAGTFMKDQTAWRREVRAAYQRVLPPD